MSNIQPYNISIPQSQIDNLKHKLSLASFPDELEGAGWDLGCPLTDIKRLTKAWEVWDWRQAEKKLNAYPQFHTDIDVTGFGSLDIHFVYQRARLRMRFRCFSCMAVGFYLTICRGCLMYFFAHDDSTHARIQGQDHSSKSSRSSLCSQNLMTTVLHST